MSELGQVSANVFGVITEEQAWAPGTVPLSLDPSLGEKTGHGVCSGWQSDFHLHDQAGSNETHSPIFIIFGPKD